MEEDWRSLYPFASHELRLDSLRYHYVDEGQGPPLLMVHGNPTWSFYWRNLIQEFRTEFRTIAPDHVGCGLSDKPSRYSYTLARHTENLVRLVDQLDLRDTTLMAHDWGGAIGLGAVLARPERFTRLVLFNTGAFPPPFIPFRIRICRIPILGKIAVQGLNAFAGAAVRMAVEKPERMTAAVKAGLLAPYNSWSHRIANYRFVRDIPTSRRHATWQLLEQLEAGLPALGNRPIKLIWGMKDWCFTPACLDRLLKSWPEADVSRLADAGHYVVEDAHEEIIPLLHEFFQENPVEDSLATTKPSG